MSKCTHYILLVLVVVFPFTGLTHARSLNDIQQTGEIRICTAGSLYQFYEDMGRVFADWLKVKPVVTHLPSWDHQFHNFSGETIKDASYIPKLLKTGQCDIYPNDLVVNDWRKKKLSFSVLYQTRMVVLVHKDNKNNYHSLKDLMGKTMGVAKNTTYHTWFEERNSNELKESPIRIMFMETDDAWKAVDEGKINFTVSNADSVFKNTAQYTQNLAIAFPIGPVTDIGWAYSKEDENLGQMIDVFFKQQQRRDSELDKIWLRSGIRLSNYMHIMATML